MPATRIATKKSGVNRSDVLRIQRLAARQVRPATIARMLKVPEKTVVGVIAWDKKKRAEAKERAKTFEPQIDLDPDPNPQAPKIKIPGLET